MRFGEQKFINYFIYISLLYLHLSMTTVMIKHFRGISGVKMESLICIRHYCVGVVHYKNKSFAFVLFKGTFIFSIPLRYIRYGLFFLIFRFISGYKIPSNGQCRFLFELGVYDHSKDST